MRKPRVDGDRGVANGQSSLGRSRWPHAQIKVSVAKCDLRNEQQREKREKRREKREERWFGDRRAGSRDKNQAVRNTREERKADGSVRFFGGYNLLAFGDFYQIPPIPSSASLAIPPIQKKTEAAKHALDLLWGDGEDSLNFFKELTIQKRIEDSWYAGIMEECRYGRLSEESYNFLVGLPTAHAGSWRADGTVECGKAACAALPEKWKRMADEGIHWPAMQALECSLCKAERDRRNQVMAGDDSRVRSEPYQRTRKAARCGTSARQKPGLTDARPAKDTNQPRHSTTRGKTSKRLSTHAARHARRAPSAGVTSPTIGPWPQTHNSARHARLF